MAIKKKTATLSNLLVEIGTEELPLDSLDVVYEHLAAIVAARLKEERLTYESISTQATPRRIAFYVKGLPAKQPDRDLEIKGPSWEKSFGVDGKPTKALEGFLRSKDAKVSEIERVASPKGDLVVLKKREKGRTVSPVLADILPGIFASLPFPKLMRWEDSGYRFPRPVRWVAALLDAKILAFELAGIKAGRITYGHRFLSPGKLSIASADWKAYQALLKKAHVVLDLSAREEAIREKLRGTYSQKEFDEELVHINAHLVEEPFALEGGFDKDYLKLPPEVLSTCMKKNQKIFACAGASGKLTNKFVAILNGKKSGLPRIRFDYENVLESRLKDARYFFLADIKEPLEARVEQLSQIAYLGKLGNMKNKAERLSRLSDFFADMARAPEKKADLKRAAWLCKADLLTQMVFEFPNIQGIAGRDYARASKESETVALAIGTHYFPKNLSEDYRKLKKNASELGAWLGLLDRMDLLTGAFSTGLEPSGSQDPYALRRAGGSLVKIVRAFRVNFSFEGLFKANVDLYRATGGLDISEKEMDAIQQKMEDFLKDRMIFELQLKAGSRPLEIFESVWRSHHDDLADVFDRYEALESFCEKEPEAFIQAGKVVERTGNIAKGSDGEGVEIDPGLFQEALEKELFSLLGSESAKIQETLSKRDFKETTRVFGKVFYRPIHAFFDQVMVNVEDPSIRRNRQALMRRINRLYTEKLADLSVLSRLDKE